MILFITNQVKVDINNYFVYKEMFYCVSCELNFQYKILHFTALHRYEMKKSIFLLKHTYSFIHLMNINISLNTKNKVYINLYILTDLYPLEFRKCDYLTDKYIT